MARYFDVGCVLVFYCRLALIASSGASTPDVPHGPPPKLTVGTVVGNVLDFLHRNDGGTRGSSATATALVRHHGDHEDPSNTRKGRQLFRLPLGGRINSLFNPLLLYPGWGLDYFYIWPAVVALSLGFIWPFYEYLRNGHTYYHPGFILDKDFSEFVVWYFKHKIYKKKYWNMDAYLSRYFQAHNDAIKSFFELRDVPERQLIEYANLLGVRPKVLEESTGTNGTESQGAADPAAAAKASDPTSAKDNNGTKKVEDVLEDLVDQMLEDNPSLKSYLANTTTDGGREKLRGAMRSIIQDQFRPNGNSSSLAPAPASSDPATDVNANDQSTQKNPRENEVHFGDGDGDELSPTAYAAYEEELKSSLDEQHRKLVDQIAGSGAGADAGGDYSSQIFSDLYSKYFGNYGEGAAAAVMSKENAVTTSKTSVGDGRSGANFASRSGLPPAHSSTPENPMKSDPSGSQRRVVPRGMNKSDRSAFDMDGYFRKQARRQRRQRKVGRNNRQPVGKSRRRQQQQQRGNSVRRRKVDRQDGADGGFGSNNKPGFLRILFHVVKHRFGFGDK